MVRRELWKLISIGTCCWWVVVMLPSPSYPHLSVTPPPGGVFFSSTLLKNPVSLLNKYLHAPNTRPSVTFAHKITSSNPPQMNFMWSLCMANFIRRDRSDNITGGGAEAFEGRAPRFHYSSEWMSPDFANFPRGVPRFCQILIINKTEIAQIRPQNT